HVRGRPDAPAGVQPPLDQPRGEEGPRSGRDLVGVAGPIATRGSGGRGARPGDARDRHLGVQPDRVATPELSAGLGGRAGGRRKARDALAPSASSNDHPVSARIVSVSPALVSRNPTASGPAHPAENEISVAAAWTRPWSG